MLPTVNRWPVKVVPGPFASENASTGVGQLVLVYSSSSCSNYSSYLLIIIITVYINSQRDPSAQPSFFLNPRLDSRHTPRGRRERDSLLLRVIQRFKRSRLQQPKGGMMDRPNPPLSVINSFLHRQIDQMHPSTLFF